MRRRWILAWPSILLRDRRHEDPFAGLYLEAWSETTMGHTLANRYINGKTESNPRASVGLRSVNNIQQGKAER